MIDNLSPPPPRRIRFINVASLLLTVIFIISPTAFPNRNVSLAYPPACYPATQCGTQFSTGDCSSNPYPCCDNNYDGDCADSHDGNCTWWAWRMMCKEWGYKAPSWGYAYDWYKNTNLEKGKTPKANSIFVMEGVGHVGYVFKVEGNIVYTTEMQCGYNNQYTDENGPANQDGGYRTRDITDSGFTGFIYPPGGSGLPDLNVKRVEISPSGQNNWQHSITIESGQSFKYDIETEVENKGEGDTSDTIKVRYYLSEDKNFDKDDDVRLGEDEIDKLDSNEDEQEHLSTIQAPTTPGTYYIFVYIDYDKEEEHESNNYSDDGDTAEYAVLNVVTANHKPTGYLDSADCTHIRGWARDPDTTQSIRFTFIGMAKRVLAYSWARLSRINMAVDPGGWTAWEWNKL